MRKYWCVIQSGYALYGVGKTKLSAVHDANEWLEEKTSVQEAGGGNPRINGSLCLLPCSEAVYDYIQNGGDSTSGWQENRGFVDIDKEKIICPKCGSDRCISDGSTIRKGGEIPAARCKDCGYRGPAGKFSS